MRRYHNNFVHRRYDRLLVELLFIISVQLEISPAALFALSKVTGGARNPCTIFRVCISLFYVKSFFFISPGVFWCWSFFVFDCIVASLC